MLEEQTPNSRAPGLELYLTALYGRPLLSTELLQGIGYDRASIEAVGTVHLAAFADRVVAGIHAQYMAGDTGERLFYIVARRYGLDGDEPWSVRQLATEMQVTPDRVRQLVTKALRRHRSAEQIAHLEDILRAAADSCLSGAREQ